MSNSHNLDGCQDPTDSYPLIATFNAIIGGDLVEAAF